MIASRRTQPYRAKGGRQPGMALTAMLRGKGTYLPNPADVNRARQRRARGALSRSIRR